jgi:hypothetical protein
MAEMDVPGVPPAQDEDALAAKISRQLAWAEAQHKMMAAQHEASDTQQQYLRIMALEYALRCAPAAEPAPSSSSTYPYPIGMPRPSAEEVVAIARKFHAFLSEK